MIRVLFVNDDPATLERLQGGLTGCARRWDMRFVRGAEAALKELALTPAQLVVSDARMAGMDGAEFLEQVRKRHPQAVRFVLANGLSRVDADRVMPVAHQVLTRPDDTLTLQRAIDRVGDLLGRAELPAVKRAIAAVHALPPLPDLYWKLTAELRQPSATSTSVAAIIENDPAMSARVLQLANSPYYSFGKTVRTVRDAATRLGLEQLRSALVLLVMSAAKTPLRPPKGFSMAALQERSQQVAALAASMLAHPEERKTAFSAGTLHHVGYFVLAAGMPDDYARVMAAAPGRPVEQVESELLGCNHAEVGAFMLTLLGLPLPLVEAVAHHHRPSASADRRFGPVAAVHIASLLASAQDGAQPEEAWDQEFLRRVGAQEVVARWRAGEPIKAVF